MSNPRIRAITLDAMFIAILALMTFIPQFGFIFVNANLSLTLIPLPVLIGVYIGGYKRGIIYGTAFGVLSFIKALSSPGTDALLFTNPVVAIAPRIIFGLIAAFLFAVVKRYFSEKKGYLIYLGIASGIASLLHGIITLTFAGIFFPQIWPLFLLILLTNTTVEAAVSGILVPIIISALRVILLHYDLGITKTNKRVSHDEITPEK
ncbi:MAG: ECF transporter S component [Bacilli bacterium]